MKEILVAIGGALFGVGSFLLLATLSEQNAPNPILILEVFRPTAFYLIFGLTATCGAILLGVGTLQKQK